MTTAQLATEILSIARELRGRLDCRFLAKHLNVSADELNAAIALLGKKIINVRGAGHCIQAA